MRIVRYPLPQHLVESSGSGFVCSLAGPFGGVLRRLLGQKHSAEVLILQSWVGGRHIPCRFHCYRPGHEAQPRLFRGLVEVQFLLSGTCTCPPATACSRAIATSLSQQVR